MSGCDKGRLAVPYDGIHRTNDSGARARYFAIPRGQRFAT